MYRSLMSEDFIGALNASLDLSAVVDQQGLIVQPNRALLDALGISSAGAVLGKRIGDVARCSRFLLSKAGCGKGAGCAFCGVNRAIMECIHTGRPVEVEAALVLNEGANLAGSNYRVSATPFEIAGKRHALVVLRDISAEKARRFVDTYLLHYLIDQIGGIHGLSGFLADSLEPGKHQDLALSIAESSADALDHIQQYMRLIDAESGKVRAAFGEIRLEDLLQRILETCSTELGLELTVDNGCQPETVILSDSALLVDSLIFIIKAACVDLGPERKIELRANSSRGRFWIYLHMNDYVVPQRKYHLFDRWSSDDLSFRSLEPYLARLYVERYLNGKVGCRSAKELGTTYYIAIPWDASAQLTDSAA